LLDTNILSVLIRNPQGHAARRIAKVGENSVCTSIIVAAELRYGCAKSGSMRLSKAVEDLLGEIEATIVTANADEFKRVRGLKVENWLA
jgi:tRNA(fMet)-specific endonuclease VapC